jgi:restriction endonuclease S subunit
MMMWCRRSEFDRNAWFMTDNSVRGGFSWADFCDMKLPVPSIEKQREIVREYNVVNDRISLNEQLTQKLEDTVQTIHKQWFVDFEFPISREYAEFIGNPELEGKPYKSSGGEMEMCDNLQSLIPKNWHTVVLGDIAVEKKEAFKLLNDFKIVSYIGLEHMPKKSISLRYWENISSIGSNKSKFTEGSILFGKLRPYFHKVGVAFVDGICSTDIIVCQPKGANLFGLVLTVMSSVSFVDYSNSGWSGTKMPRTSWNFMADYRVTIPKKAQLLEHFNNVVSVQTNYLKSLAFENRALGEFVEIINTKMSKA